jgi:hypothetical protein
LEVLLRTHPRLDSYEAMDIKVITWCFGFIPDECGRKRLKSASTGLEHKKTGVIV